MYLSLAQDHLRIGLCSSALRFAKNAVGRSKLSTYTPGRNGRPDSILEMLCPLIGRTAALGVDVGRGRFVPWASMCVPPPLLPLLSPPPPPHVVPLPPPDVAPQPLPPPWNSALGVHQSFTSFKN